VFTLNLSPVPAQSHWQDVTFSPRYTNRTYTVEYSDSLNHRSFTALTNAVVNDAGTTRTVMDTKRHFQQPLLPGENRLSVISCTWPCPHGGHLQLVRRTETTSESEAGFHGMES